MIALIRSPAVFACGERGYSFLDLAVILTAPFQLPRNSRLSPNLRSSSACAAGFWALVGGLTTALGWGVVAIGGSCSRAGASFLVSAGTEITVSAGKFPPSTNGTAWKYRSWSAS